jgi:hypothetical protein
MGAGQRGRAECGKLERARMVLIRVFHAAFFQSFSSASSIFESDFVVKQRKNAQESPRE